MLVQSGNQDPSLDAQGGLDYINDVMTKAVKDSMIDTYRRCAVVTGIKPLSVIISIWLVLRTIVKEDTTLEKKKSTSLKWSYQIFIRKYEK